MSKAVFEIKEVMSLGWEAFKKNALILIVLLLISFFANVVVSLISGLISMPAIIASILATAVGAYFTLSTIRASYDASRGQQASWKVLQNDWRPYIKFFVIFILLSIIFVISALLLIVPVLFSFALFLCVPFIFAENPQIGIIEVFQKSWSISIKHVWALIAYVLLWLVIIFATAIVTLGLAILITAPLFYVTSAYVYKKLDAAANGAVEADFPTVNVQELTTPDETK
jgi:hypothetical protein